eukprot:scaffold10139_cov80-Attheya_sp.AAC.7
MAGVDNATQSSLIGCGMVQNGWGLDISILGVCTIDETTQLCHAATSYLATSLLCSTVVHTREDTVKAMHRPSQDHKIHFRNATHFLNNKGGNVTERGALAGGSLRAQGLFIFAKHPSSPLAYHELVSRLQSKYSYPPAVSTSCTLTPTYYDSTL